MRISRVVVKNFRSIQSLEVDIPQICALVGPNNAGKSNLLLAIQRVLGREWISISAFDEEDVFGREAAADVSISLSFDPPIPYSRFKGAEPAEVVTLSFAFTRYKVGNRKGERRLEQKCYAASGKVPMVLSAAPQKNQQRKYQPLVGIPAELRAQIPLIYIGTNRSLREQLPSARYSLLRQLFEDIDRDLHDPRQTVKVRQGDGSEVDVPRAQRFGELMEAALRLLRTEEFDNLESAIKENALRQLGFDLSGARDSLDFFFAPFDTLDFYKSLDLLVREGDFTLSATQLGEGMQNALVLSILQAFEARRKQGAILLIEEPEMFLHPQMQRSLCKTLREIGLTNQVIYTTHSPHFVSVPDYQDVLLVRKGTKGTEVHRSGLPPDPRRREKLIKELDPERNELFFAARLLLVEGDTEKLAIPEYARRLGYDLDREGVTIVEVGGKRNLPEFIRIASSFCIPVDVLYDQDSSEFSRDREEESRFNKLLDGFEQADGSVRIWRLTKNYEAALRTAVGEEKYTELCQKYPVAKPTRARLIALESELPVPEPLPSLLTWVFSRSGAPPGNDR